MKIAPKSIEGFLASPPAHYRAILLYGPDAGLIRERAKLLIEKTLGKNHDPFALVELMEAKLTADPALLSDELSAISMMAPKRVIWLRDAGDKLTKIIAEASEQFHADALLLVSGDELSSRSSLRAWFEKDPAAAAIACYHDEVRDVSAVIRKTFEEAQVNADRDAVEYLSQQLGNDRYVTRQELEKCITYAGVSKHLTLPDVQALVDYNREANFDDLVNAVADRNLGALERHLTLILREGNQPVAYLRILQRYFNRLYAIRAKMNEGISAEAVVQGLRPPVFFRQIPILTRHAQTWQTDHIVRALRALINAELACKTSDLPIIPASSRRLLQMTQIR
ncbi:MAG: DNA polymerase III subunit delta [Rickettsiales bacterium]|nr:DNA polymerase III subunit delta [Rickettsiales bacterium]